MKVLDEVFGIGNLIFLLVITILLICFLIFIIVNDSNYDHTKRDYIFFKCLESFPVQTSSDASDIIVECRITSKEFSKNNN